MKDPGISALMIRTAWKMVDTVFEQHRLSRQHRDQLLNLTTAVALHDLADQRLTWARRPPEGLRLVFAGRSVEASSDPSRGALRARFADHQIEEACEHAESLFDQYRLDEDERDTLFTALPCLGLHALQAWLKWKKAPPFPEVSKSR